MIFKYFIGIFVCNLPEISPKESHSTWKKQTYADQLKIKSKSFLHNFDRLCGLMVRVLGYRSGGPGSIPVSTGKKVGGPERGPLSLVSTTEELLDRKIAAPVQKTENTAVGIRRAGHVAPSIRKSWQSLRWQAAVARSV
jgi:hypothetical protein